jgi:hypothetical protein
VRFGAGSKTEREGRLLEQTRGHDPRCRRVGEIIDELIVKRRSRMRYLAIANENAEAAGVQE